MCFKQYLKRILPFFLTFSLGLLIASFFVTIAAPNFNFKKRGWSKHRQYHQRLEFENRQLREENLRLKRQISQSEMPYVMEAPPLPPAPSIDKRTR